MSPFDLKAWVLAPNAQHPVVIHFPIALFIVSYAFDVLAVWRRKAALIAAARYNLLAAAWAAPVALATGLIAWQWKHEGVALKGNLRLHLIGAVSSAVFIRTLCWLRRRGNRLDLRQSGIETSQSPGKIYFVFGFLTMALIILTAHIGGVVAG